MTNERLEQLKQRVEQAQTLSAEIDVLKASTKFRDLAWQLEADVFSAGKAKLLSLKMAQLESLLADPQPVPQSAAPLVIIPCPTPPFDPVCGVDCTAQQPAEPFATVTCNA